MAQSIAKEPMRMVTVVLTDGSRHTVSIGESYCTFNGRDSEISATDGVVAKKLFPRKKIKRVILHRRELTSAMLISENHEHLEAILASYAPKHSAQLPLPGL